MLNFNQKQEKIINILLKNKELTSSAIHTELLAQGESVALITVKRALSSLVKVGALKLTGTGRATVYSPSSLGRIFSAVDARAYCAIEPDRRFGLQCYNFEILSDFPTDIFSTQEQKILITATAEYHRRIKDLPPTIQKKELERLVIELAWKSSKIEGNTYTLLDTEKLILENKVAAGKTREETQMILNHKEAFNFVRVNRTKFKILNRKNLEELHALIVYKLRIGHGLRTKPVGVLGSLYQPLDNIYQITDALATLSKKMSGLPSPYAKALFALLALAYIQPFEDGNKRTARLAANALLLAHNLAPLSYRSIDEESYREAMLVFYELNSVVPFKKIFIEQYVFAAEHYAVK